MGDQTLLYLTDPAPFSEKERLYLEVRRREGRVLSDATVQNLPGVNPSSPYAREWQWRQRSFNRLKHDLIQKPSKSLNILDLGCGNGWMSNRLAENRDWTVTGIDLNEAELTQAARLFGRKNLQFVYADVCPNAVPGTPVSETSLTGAFDIIILAASIQYFSDLDALMTTLRPLLKSQGEIHCIDSQFYPDIPAQQAARQRTMEYYSKVGVPEMAAYYHHHLSSAWQKWGGENMNSDWWTKGLQKIGWLAPFPWIRLRLL